MTSSEVLSQSSKIVLLIFSTVSTKDIEEKTIVYEHSFSLDTELIRSFVSKECSKYNTEPKNAQIHQRHSRKHTTNRMFLSISLHPPKIGHTLQEINCF